MNMAHNSIYFNSLRLNLGTSNTENEKFSILLHITL